MEGNKSWLIALRIAIAISVLGGLALFIVLINQNNSLQQQLSEAKQEQSVMVNELSAKIEELKTQTIGAIPTTSVEGVAVSTVQGSSDSNAGADVDSVEVPSTSVNGTETFFNNDGGYRFDYVNTWTAFVSKYNKINSLFGPKATNSSGLGGVEVVTKTSSASAYIDYLKNNSEMSISSQQKITLAGEPESDAIKYKNQKGYGVIISHSGKIYNIYINSFNSTELKNFDFLINSFVFYR